MLEGTLQSHAVRGGVTKTAVMWLKRLAVIQRHFELYLDLLAPGNPLQINSWARAIKATGCSSSLPFVSAASNGISVL